VKNNRNQRRCRRDARRLFSQAENGLEVLESVRDDLDYLVAEGCEVVEGVVARMDHAIEHLECSRTPLARERAFGKPLHGWRGVNRVVAVASKVLKQLRDLREAITHGDAARARQAALLAIRLIDDERRLAG
jgi:hypothetical protein